MENEKKIQIHPKHFLIASLIVWVVITLVSLCALLSMTSCTSMNISGPAQWDQLSPKDRLTLAMKIYNSEYDDYLAAYKYFKSHPDVLNDEIHEGMRLKKEALKNLHLAIRSYKHYIETGTIPPEAVDQALRHAVYEFLY